MRYNGVDKITSKEIGLDIGTTIMKYCFDSEHLHYAMFEDMEVNFLNLARAQENYQNYLLQQLPQNTESI